MPVSPRFRCLWPQRKSSRAKEKKQKRLEERAALDAVCAKVEAANKVSVRVPPRCRGEPHPAMGEPPPGAAATGVFPGALASQERTWAGEGAWWFWGRVVGLGAGGDVLGGKPVIFGGKMMVWG